MLPVDPVPAVADNALLPPARPWLPWLALGLALGALAPQAMRTALGIGDARLWWWLLGLPLTGTAVWLDARMPWAARWMLFAAAALLGGAVAIGTGRAAASDVHRLLAVEGVVDSIKWTGPRQGLVLLPTRPVMPADSQPPRRLFVRTTQANGVAPGDVVVVKGLWSRDGRGDSLDAEVLERVCQRENGPRGWAWRALDHVGPHRELAGALLLGVGDAPEKDVFRKSGLLHLLAVSGAHLAIAAALGAWLLRLAGMAWGPRQIVLGLLIVGYAWLTSATPATLRALAMSLAVVAAGALAREPHRLAAVALAALALVVIDPRNASDLGFQLSLAAVLGIVTLGLDLCALRRRWLPLQPWPLDRPTWRGLLLISGVSLDGLAIGVAATLATTPIIAWTFGTANPWSPLTTLAATPPTAAALWLGLPLMALDGCWPTGPWEGLYVALEASLAALVRIVEWSAALPGASLATGAPSALTLVAWPLLFLPLRDGRDALLRIAAGLLLIWSW